MPPSEFNLIDQYFTRRAKIPGAPIELGIGDDCALLTPLPGEQLAISTDMLVAGRHFFEDVEPRALGHKALAVNLSDLAAMGATPLAFTLAISLPQPIDASRLAWLDAFSDGLFALAGAHHCTLIGGDTTAGPLTLCLTVLGSVKKEHALQRAAAKIDDDIWVSGTLGDARLALGEYRQEWIVEKKYQSIVRRALEWPQPRIALGLALPGIAHAAIDLSDGLAGDLAHITQRSAVGATVMIDHIPRSEALAQQPLSIQYRCMLSGGDDYELCFTAPPTARTVLTRISADLSLSLTRIGKITALPKAPDHANATLSPIVWIDHNGVALADVFRGFDHFH
jgi:thiamine-monophosphate kinase